MIKSCMVRMLMGMGTNTGIQVSVETSHSTHPLCYQQTLSITCAGIPAHGITSVSETAVLIS